MTSTELLKMPRMKLMASLLLSGGKFAWWTTTACSMLPTVTRRPDSLVWMVNVDQTFGFGSSWLASRSSWLAPVFAACSVDSVNVSTTVSVAVAVTRDTHLLTRACENNNVTGKIRQLKGFFYSSFSKSLDFVQCDYFNLFRPMWFFHY